MNIYRSIIGLVALCTIFPALADEFNLFTVYKNHQDTNTYFLSPIGSVKNNNLMHLPATRKELTDFISATYPVGKKLQLIFSGTEKVTATVVESESMKQPHFITCRKVQLSSEAAVNDRRYMLAADSPNIAGSKLIRRKLNEEEKKIIFKLVEDFFRHRQKDKIIDLEKMQVMELIAYQPKNDKAKLIGNFILNSKSLFLIMEPIQGSYQMTYYDYHPVVSYAKNRRVIDSIDLDNDGEEELISVIEGDDGQIRFTHIYSILKKQFGKWKEAYQGSGGGCDG